MEWDLFKKIAIEEEVASVAYQLLMQDPQKYQLAAFDPEVLKRFEDFEAVVAVRNAVLFRQLGHLERTLTSAKIPVVLLKGADLARSIYPSPSMRSMTDLDLLVPQSDFEQALELVNALGYHAHIPEASHALDRLLSYHAHLRKDSVPPVLLELHWMLLGSPAYRYMVPMDWFWQNIEPCQGYKQDSSWGKGSSVSCLNPTANLLYLSAHQILHHRGERVSLRWLLDIHYLVGRRQADLDWQSLARQARLFGWSKVLVAALEWAQACFGTCLPGGLLETLQAGSGAFDALVDLKSAPAPTRILGEWKNLSTLNWQARLWQFLALLAPTPAYMRWRYRPRPEWIWPLYYIYRWVDIAVDAAKSLKYIFHPAVRR